MDLGADMIGGWCGVDPEQIISMGKIIYQWNMPIFAVERKAWAQKMCLTHRMVYILL